MAKTSEPRKNEWLYPWKMLMKGLFVGVGIAIDAGNAMRILEALVDEAYKETVGIMKPLLPWLPIEVGRAVKRLAKQTEARLLLDTTTNMLKNLVGDRGLVLIFDDAQW